MQDEEVHRHLANVLGPHNISVDEASLRRYASDALRPGRFFPGSDTLQPRPQWVTWPETVAQVQELLRFASQHAIPVVPYGGGTGLMGGATASTGGIVLSLSKLDRIREVCADDLIVTAEAGVVLRDLDAALNQQGLILGHDPWTVPVATVGGAISTNSLGYRGAVYGSMGEQVLGMEVVLPDGSLVATRAVPKSSTGLSLQHLFIGGEGCFGVITAATIKAFPQPEQRSLHALHFPDFPSAYRTVTRLFHIGIVPSLLDMGEEFDLEANSAAPVTEVIEMYLGFEGVREVVDAQAGRTRTIWLAEGGIEQDPQEARHFWESRHLAADGFRRRREESGLAPYFQPASPPVMDYAHMAIPASKVLSFREQCMQLIARHKVGLREFGLWNRPELFSVVLVDRHGMQDDRLGRAMEAMLMLAQDMGGSMEYCHGVGLRLAYLMEREHGTGLDLLKKLKHTLDPKGIMNPGKLGL